MLSPKPLDEIQPNLVCELLTRMGRATSTFFFGPAPMGRGPKVKYHLISIKKSISKIFIPNIVFSQMKDKNISDGICILSPQGWDAGGAQGGGGKKKFKHGQVVYQIDGDDEQNRIQVKFHPRVKLVTWGEVKYHKISVTMSISKIFIPNFVCVLTNERYKTYQTGFLFCRLGHAPGVGHWGTQGVKQFFVQTWS